MQHRLIGLYGKNRWEWLTSLHAAYAYKMTGVPLYDTLGVDAISYITNQTGLQTVCCSSVETAKLISFKRERAAELATLVNVVQWEDVSEEARKAASDAGLALRSFTEVCEAGSFNKQPHTPPSPSDMAIICYTYVLPLPCGR
ncbi:hypothetical protein EON67_02265 [archaeon]|nr:MAG: hypothetical protein EON67_02265 [archaeon]